MSRIPCTQCGNEILPATAKLNDGLCAPCVKGGSRCSSCGVQLWPTWRFGESLCEGCWTAQKIDGVAKESGISWPDVESIDWDVFVQGVSSATRSAFESAAKKHSDRPVKELILAYRLDVGVAIEPWVGFEDGGSLNLMHDDEAISDRLLADLEPYHLPFLALGDFASGDDEERFRVAVDQNTPTVVRRLREFLDAEDFGFSLVEGCGREVKEY